MVQALAGVLGVAALLVVAAFVFASLVSVEVCGAAGVVFVVALLVLYSTRER